MSEKLTQEQAVAEIQRLTQEAQTLITQAEQLADEYGIPFTFSVAYGMGGTYIPAPSDKEDWNRSDCYEDEENYGWVSSTSDCY